MFFTQEDYKKIQHWLALNSKKDTEFNEAITPLNGNETIAFVQNGYNVKAPLKDFLAQLTLFGVSDFLNITEKYNERNISLNEAIQLIPFKDRKTGQVITFLDEEGKWQIYQFQGERVNQWNTTSLWVNLIKEFIGEANITADEEDLTSSIKNDKSVLKFKDKSYNEDDFSGLGRVYLRKNITEVIDPTTRKNVRINLLTQSMLGKDNTIYIIQYDYNLNGQILTVPENSILDFKNGGNFSNGTINCINTTIRIDNFDSLGVTLSGTYKVVSALNEDKSPYMNDTEYNIEKHSGLGHVYLRKNKGILTQDNFNRSNTIYHIKYDFDLKGEEVTIPENCILKFEGGSISNGNIIGNNTEIGAPQNSIFHSVNIDGTFKNNVCYTIWFGDKISEINKCIKLSPIVEFTKNKEYRYDLIPIIPINNTILRGNNCVLHINNTNSSYYKIIQVYNVENVEIQGFNIIGDAEINAVDEGEWGMGISIIDSKNVRVTNNNVKHCFGDGIYIAGNSENVVVDNCICDNNRRQGMSVIQGVNLLIKNSTFCNTGLNNYIAPGAGIDVEPNKNSEIIDIFIENCRFFNNHDGKDILIATLTKTEESRVRIKDCVLENNIELTASNNIEIYNTLFKELYIIYSNNIFITNSTFNIVILRSFESKENNTYYSEVYDILIDSCNIKSESDLIYVAELQGNIERIFVKNSFLESNKESVNFCATYNNADSCIFDINFDNTLIKVHNEIFLNCGSYFNCNFNVSGSIHLSQRHGVSKIINSRISSENIRTYQIDDKTQEIYFIGNIAECNVENALINGSGTPIKIKYANNLFTNASEGGKVLMRNTLSIIDITDNISTDNTYAPQSAANRGYQYYNTDLNKPVFWTGTKWVDATGANI